MSVNLFPANIPIESAQATVQIDASGSVVLNNAMKPILIELSEPAAHHLQLNNEIDDGPALKASHAYNYILKNLNEVNAQGGNVFPMARVFYELKRKMLVNHGIARDKVRLMAVNNITRQRARRLIP